MIFLIEYDRATQRKVQLVQYADSEREMAQNDRFSLELRLHQAGIDHEAVILEAENETALHSSHQRYFLDLKTVLNSITPK